MLGLLERGWNADAEAAPLILDLQEIGPGERPLVGAKAFHLARLIHAGFAVPPGFCVTAEAFRRCESREGKPVLTLALREAIIAAWHRSRIEIAAVRSSASEEDGQDASFAGVFPTVLPVRSEEEMLAAIEACFRALHAPEAQAYRKVHRGGGTPVMAVLVQALVDADAAGVIYTANPVTGAKGEIVINAVHGLGEPFSSGRLSGDVFVLSPDGRVNSVSISPKPFMLTSSGEVALPWEEAQRPAISEAEAAALAQLATQVESAFGSPQDIEFAISGGRVYLLQARPITGLREDAPITEAEIEAYLASERSQLMERIEALRASGRLQGADAVFSNGNVGELLPTPTPMSFGLFRTIFADRGASITTGRRVLGYRLDETSAENLYELIGGQIYFNVEIDARTFDIGLPLDIDAILSAIAKDPSRASYPEFGLYEQGLSLAEAVAAYGKREGRLRHAALWSFHDAMTRTAHGIEHRFRLDIEPVLRRSLKPAGLELLSASNAALLAAFRERLDHLKVFDCVWFVMAARLAFYFAEMVRWRLDHCLGQPQLAQSLFQGLEGSLITQESIELEKLAQGQITRDAFLQAYGHGAPNELEISLPRLSENPATLDGLLQDLKLSGRRPGEDFRELQCRRLHAEADIRQRLEAAGIACGEVSAFFADLRLAQTFLPLRETIKHYYTGDYRALRDILLEIGRRLGWKDDDIFYLDPSEIPGCFENTEMLAKRVGKRRRQRKIAARLAALRRLPAAIFASDLASIGRRPKTAGPQSLDGAPIAPGAATGRVRLVADATERMHVGRGDIIVTHSANLGLAPILRVAAGLIVEVGGVLAHAACQARESGIPAVVLDGATALLKDGMAVFIDGATGRIELIEDGAAS